MAQRMKQARPPRNARLPLVSVDAAIVPLFSRRPPWWARNPETAGLLLCDLIVTGAFIELTWNHWTEMTIVPPPKDAPEGAQSTVEWNLRPTWQRAGLCAGHFVAGCFFAGGLLGLKAQFIRSLTILPPKVVPGAGSAKSKAAATTKAHTGDFGTAVIQNASHPKNTGFEFPLRTSWLEEGRDKTEISLRSSELGSRWFLGLTDASINGKKYVSTDEARSLLLNQWKTIRPPLPASRSKA